MKTAPALLDAEARLPNMPPPSARFEPREELAPALRPMWNALHAGNVRYARSLAESVLKDGHTADDERTAALAAIAAAELLAGRISTAERYAERSLQRCTGQNLSRLILFGVYIDRRDFVGAYGILMDLGKAKTAPTWDEWMSEQETQIACASLAWRLRKWEAVAGHVELAYPNGIETMPVWLLEDFFRLSLYRNRPEDAAAAAAVLIRTCPVESADALLQTLVQQGWTEQALPLYRRAFSDEPRSALLRRRLVALCLREGAVEEARALTKSSALELTRHGSKRGAASHSG